jgi:hypothetical protein
MNKTSILLTCNLGLSEINIDIKPSDRKVDPELESQVASTWAKILKEAEKSGQLAYENEYTYRLNGFTFDKGNLELEIAQIPFSIRYALTKLPRTFELREDYWPKGLFVASIVKTSDDFFVFGSKSSKNLSSNALKVKKIDPIGGMLDEQVLDVNLYLDKMLKNELLEEAGINPKFIEEVRCIGLLISRSSNIGIINYTRINVTKNELNESFKQLNDGEFSDLIFVEKSELEQFTSELEDYRVLLWDLYKTYTQSSSK